jgi:hypothetical protein
MNHAITVSFSDQLWTALQERSTATGTPPDKIVSAAVEQLLARPPRTPRKLKEDMTEEEKAEARRRFRSHFGSVSLGTGTDNESIDADLAREYGDNHEPK